MRSLSSSLADFLYDRPRLVAGVLAAVVLVSVGALPFLKVRMGWDPFYDRDTPQQAVMNEVRAQFANDDLVYVAYEADDTFSAPVLSELRRVGQVISSLQVKGAGGAPIAAVAEVTSLATVKDLLGEDANFRTVALVPDPVPAEPVALDRIRARARRNPVIRENLLGHDDRVGAFVVRLSPSLTDLQNSEAVERIRAVLAEGRAKAPQPSAYHPAGKSVLISDIGRTTVLDVLKFIPAIYAVIVVLLALFLRRWWGLLLALTNVTLCFLAGMACLTAIGGAINDLSSVMPSIVMILSVTTAIHFLSEYAKHARDGGQETAPRLVLRELLAPSWMAALTTAVGFASLATSAIPALREFGIALALAVLVSFVVSFSLMVLATRWKAAEAYVSPRGIAQSPAFEGWIRAYSDLVIRHRWAFLVASVVVVTLGGLGVTRLKVDTNHLEYFDDTSPLRKANAFIEDRLGGTSVLVVSIRTDEAERFTRPEELKKVEALERFLVDDLKADSVVSPVDFIKLMHRAFLGDDEAQFRLPDTSDQVAQLLVLNGDPLFAQYLDPSHRWVRLTLRSREHTISRLAAQYAAIDAYLATHFPASEGYRAAGTGENRLIVTLVTSIVDSQISSLGTSFLLIFLPIFLLFRSIRAGLFSIPSNIFPVVLTLGVMGWLGIPLNIATVMISSMTLGIAVDDTLHFIQHLRLRLTVHGELERALRETFLMKGVGVLWTGLVISLGFGVLLLSSFSPTRHFGALAALAMVTGIVAELFLLPPLLLVTGTRLGTKVEAPPQP